MKKKEIPVKDFYTLQEAAKILNCHRNTIFYKCMDGKIPFERKTMKGGEAICITAETLDMVRKEIVQEIERRKAILEAHPIQKRNQKGR